MKAAPGPEEELPTMSADLLSAAKAEEQRLLRELQATALFRRLEAVRALLVEYEATPVRTPSSEPRQRRQNPREPSMTTQVIAVAQDHLRQIQRRAQSLEILQVAQERGIEVKGTKPTTVVASILSHCDLFDNVRGQGYGLKEWSADQGAKPEPSGAFGELLGDDQTDEANRDDDVDISAQSALQSNGATNPDRSWPRFGS
jgi:hypothetical protein